MAKKYNLDTVTSTSKLKEAIVNKLDARLDRLENALGIGGIDITIFIDLLPSGPLTGVRVGQTVVKRPPAESESVFISRMHAEHRRVGANAILLIGERE